MSKREKLIKDATNAVDALYGDTTVESETTMSYLKELRDHIEILLCSLADDIAMKEED